MRSIERVVVAAFIALLPNGTFASEALALLNDEDIARQIQKALARGQANTESNQSEPVQSSGQGGHLSITASDRAPIAVTPLSYDREAMRVYEFTGVLKNHRAFELAITGDVLWAATSAGLLRIDTVSNKWQLVPVIFDKKAVGLRRVIATGPYRLAVRAYHQQAKNYIKTAGSFWYRNTSPSWVPVINNQYSEPLYWDGREVWLRQGRKLVRVAPNSDYVFEVNKKDHPAFAKATVRRMAAQGYALWAASYGDHQRGTKKFIGGGLFHKSAVDRWTHFDTADGLASDYCSDVVADANEVWVGHWHEERGLSRRRGQQRWQAVTRSANGLDIGGVDLALDSRYLWIAQQGGLVRLERETLLAKIFEKSDGIPGHVVSDVIIGRNHVWATAYSYDSRSPNNISSAGIVRLDRGIAPAP